MSAARKASWRCVTLRSRNGFLRIVGLSWLAFVPRFEQIRGIFETRGREALVFRSARSAPDISASGFAANLRPARALPALRLAWKHLRAVDQRRRALAHARRRLMLVSPAVLLRRQEPCPQTSSQLEMRSSSSTLSRKSLFCRSDTGESRRASIVAKPGSRASAAPNNSGTRSHSACRGVLVTVIACSGRALPTQSDIPWSALEA